jgi:hypothetical protein
MANMVAAQYDLVFEPNETYNKSVLQKMQRAMTMANGNNSEELAPWLAAPLWVLGASYLPGYFVRNSAGNLYQKHPSQVTTVSLGTEPTHVDNTGVYDGGGTSGCLWFYRGPATGLDTSTPLVGLSPTTSASVPTGVISFLSNSTGYSATACTIVAGTGANGAPVGKGLITLGTVSTGSADRGSMVIGTGVAAGTQILYWNSGSGGTGSIGVVNISQTIASTAFSFGGISGAGGLGLTRGFQVSNAQMPCTVSGGPLDLTTNPFTVLGPNSGTAAAPIYATASMKPAVAFETNARWLGIRLSSSYFVGDSHKLKVEVDGRLISHNRPIYTYTTGDPYYLYDFSKLPQTKSGYRTVRLFGANRWPETLAFIFQFGPNDYVGPVKNVNSYKMSWEGDSLTGGGNGTPYDDLSTQARICANLLGCDNVYDNAQGGTGFLANSNNTKTTYIQRIDRINLFAPDIHITGGNHNDLGDGLGSDGILRTSATRTVATAAYHTAFRAANPNAIHIITGSKVLRGDSFTGTTGLIACENDLATVVASFRAAGDNLIFFVPTITDPNGDTANNSGWWTGGSAVGRYFYNTAPFTDGHPLPADHEMFAHRLAHAVRGIISNLNT